MDYAPRQQQILDSYANDQQRGLQVLIFDKANELNSRIKGLQLEHRVRVVQQLAELNRAYWGDGQSGMTQNAQYDAFALSLQRNLERWQWLQGMHAGVIGELEILVAGQAVSAASVR